MKPDHIIISRLPRRDRRSMPDNSAICSRNIPVRVARKSNRPTTRKRPQGRKETSRNASSRSLGRTMNSAAGLEAYGFLPAMRAALDARGSMTKSPRVSPRCTEGRRRRHALASERGECLCFARAQVRRVFQRRHARIPHHGRFVLIAYNEQGDSTITETLPRRSLFARKNPTLGEADQVVAANFDSAFMMQSLNHDLNPKRLERYLTLGAGNCGRDARGRAHKSRPRGAPATPAAASNPPRLAAGCDVFAVSAKTG